MLSKSVSEKLNVIEKICNNYNESIYKKAKDSDLTAFANWLSKKNLERIKLSINDYLELTKDINGINFNGLFIYSIDDRSEYSIYKENEIIWEDDNQKKYIFFGDDSISWYCLNIDDMKYYILDKPSGTTVSIFHSFSEILDVILDSIIN